MAVRLPLFDSYLLAVRVWVVHSAYWIVLLYSAHPGNELSFIHSKQYKLVGKCC